MRGRRKQNAVILHFEKSRIQMVIIMAQSISTNLPETLSKRKTYYNNFTMCVHVNACIALPAAAARI